MKKVFHVLLPVLKGFLYCAICIQVMLGAWYIGNQFLRVPQFKDTSVYLKMAEQFVMDEYTGVLYPLLVKLCSLIFQSYYFIPIYLLQLAAGFVCVYRFVCAFTAKKLPAVLCALWINTIPFAAQIHMTVLPHSLAFSCMACMLLEVCKATWQKRHLRYPQWAVILCSFTILCQLTRGYMWCGILFLVWAVLLQMYAKAHKWLISMVMAFMCMGIVVCNVAIYYATETKGYYGRIQKTPESVFFQRTAVPILMEKYMIYMPPEISENFEWEELDMFGKYPYKLQEEMGPILEARYGKERAAEIYVALGILGWETATRDNLISYAEDVFSYAFPQWTYADWRDGNVKGMTSWNYQQFMKETSVFSVYYFTICHYMWMVGLCLTLVCFAVLMWQHRKYYIRMWLPVVILLLLYGAILALRGTGVYDYKMALLPMTLGYAPLCIALFMKRQQNGEVYEAIEKKPI